MKRKKSIPSAPMLIESMRSIGYTFEAALADIIDNSLSARAKKIDIYFGVNEEPYIAILDNGVGMTSKELEEAMRFGSSNPNGVRSEDDLGRFGLGMKSASMSQCRELIVVSHKDEEINSFSWNLDFVIDQNDWVITQLDDNEIGKLPRIHEFLRYEEGTYVLWRNFDRIETTTNDIALTIEAKMLDSIDYLALIFHRFLDEGINISINNELLPKRDPFLKSSKKTQRMRPQTIMIEGTKIKVEPYVLPFISKLSAEEVSLLGEKETLKREQGFYIYRNKRLIVWGTWFRIRRQEELGKLSRIQVDIPNTLDYMWSIDVKKSSANIPPLIRDRLLASIRDSVSSSKQVMKYRGRKKNKNSDIDFSWNIIEKDGITNYIINREFPMIKLFEESLSKEQLKLFSVLIKDIEEGFPSRSLYNDLSEEKKTSFDLDIEKSELQSEFQYRLEQLMEFGMVAEEATQILMRYDKYRELG